MTEDEKTKEATRNRRQFRVLRKAHKVRGFQLELSAIVSGYTGECRLQMLKETIAKEKARKGFDASFSEPLVRYNPY